MQVLRIPLTIANGADTSDELTDARTLGAARTVTVIAPAALTNACKLEIGDVTGGTFGTAQQPAGTDIALATGKSVILPRVTGGSIRVKSAGAEGAARTFILMVQVDC